MRAAMLVGVARPSDPALAPAHSLGSMMKAGSPELACLLAS